MSFTPSNPPKRGGSFSRFIVKRRETLASSTSGVVALPFTHDWGPFKTFVRVNSLAEFNAIYGEGVTRTAGYIAVYNAFKGLNSDEPGAGQVVAYRTGAAAAAKATKTLNNTTPAVALTLSARYEGTRGNNLSVAVEQNTADALKNDLVILEAGVVLERWAHVKTDIAGLATTLNTKSGWVTAVSNINAIALAVVAASALTGGNDGATLVAGDWTALMSAFETQTFQVFVPYDLSDTTIQGSLVAWTKVLNNRERSRRFYLGLGGALNETSAQAEARSVTIDDENVFYLGIGSYSDTRLVQTMSPAQLVPRIAGIVASRGIDSAVSFAHLSDLSITVGPTDAEILSAISMDAGRGGLVVLSQDSVGVRIEKGRSTRVSDSLDRPKETFGNIKYVFVMQEFERQLQIRHEGGDILGKLDVNADTREYLVGDAKALLDSFIDVGAIQNGAVVGVAADPPPSDSDEFVALDWTAKFGRSLEQVRNTFYMS